MRKIIKFVLFLFPGLLFGQWTDTIYTIETLYDIEYGSAIDFAGNQRTLALDISYPINDTMPECGRPLLVMIHGGAFITGDKNEGTPKRIREDFAKRGYTTASVNYRLGMFQTNQAIHCNVSNFGIEWDCLNMADTSEWYRAYFRGVQDVNGAIRYLVNHSDTYGVDPENIFVVGESAGGFIALGVGYIDNESDVLITHTSVLEDVQAPNTIYEAPCIQSPLYDLDTSIASMNLARPDLGSYQGILNYPADIPYTIKGVGNFYGAVFNNIFQTNNNNDLPSLYMYHQPNDLIVPYTSSKVLAGFANCATQFGCAYIVNRPTVFGSIAIKDTLDDMSANNIVIPPNIAFTSPSNNADCLQQLLDPSLAGHAIHNYSPTINNMGFFFAAMIDSCSSVSTQEPFETTQRFQIYPVPGSVNADIQITGKFKKGDELTIIGLSGAVLFKQKIYSDNIYELKINPINTNLKRGIYFVQIQSVNNSETHKIVIF